MTQEEISELQMQIRAASEFVKTLRVETGRVIAGQEKLVRRLILALITNGHVLLEGVPGLAKTLMVKTLAKALGGSFSRIQFTPDLLPADVVGTTVYNQETHTFSIKRGPVFANIVLADEINRAPAKVQSALLECMQEHQVTISGETQDLPSPFLVMATQNPIEQEGTYPLPEAQVDRFMFKLKADYPTRDAERLVIERMAHPNPELEAIPVATIEDVLTARKWVDKIYMDERIAEYILDVVIATRPDKSDSLSSRQENVDLSSFKQYIELGASPRAGIALSLAARGLAFLEGRAYVTPEDVKELAPDVLRHRILLSYEAEADGMTTDAIVTKLLATLKTP